MRYELEDEDDSREETWARVLKAGYGEVAQEQMPDRFRELLEQLERAESRKQRACPAWLMRPPRDR